jgi:hypothetical protein
MLIGRGAFFEGEAPMSMQDDCPDLVRSLETIINACGARIDSGLRKISDELCHDLADVIRRCSIVWTSLPTDGPLPQAVTIRALALVIRAQLLTEAGLCTCLRLGAREEDPACPWYGRHTDDGTPHA